MWKWNPSPVFLPFSRLARLFSDVLIDAGIKCTSWVQGIPKLGGVRGLEYGLWYGHEALLRGVE